MCCVDLGESFQTHIYLQNLSSIQPRTSPPKFAAREREPLERGRTSAAGETCAEAFEGARTELRLDGPSSARDVSECGPGCFDYLPGPLHEFERLTLGVSLSNLLVRQN